MEEIGTFGGQVSIGRGINDAGTVVGNASTKSGTKAFLWNGGSLVDITKKSGSVAFGINNLSKPQVVGHLPLSIGTGGRQAFVWQNGKVKTLPFLASGTYAAGLAVNDPGQIVGYSSVTDSDGTSRAVLWNDVSSGPVDLGLGDGSAAAALNAHGHIVGHYSLDGVRRAFRFAQGAWQDLPPQPQAVHTDAKGINLSGTIVGISLNGQSDDAVRWQADSSGGYSVANLNTLIPLEWSERILLSDAVGINDAGQIVCTGFYRDPTTGESNGEERAFVLTPAP